MSVRSARPSDRPQNLTWKRALWEVDDGDDADETAFVWELPDGSIPAFISVSFRPWAEGCKSAPVPYVEGWYLPLALRRHDIREFGFEPTEQLRFFRKPLGPR